MNKTTIPFAKPLITACLAVMSLQSASAAIVDMGSTTVDTATNSEWLDMTATAGLSYDAVSAQLGLGGTFEGYRHATQREVLDFMADFGLIPQGSPFQDYIGVPDLNAALSFQDMLGQTGEITFPTHTMHYVRGFTLWDAASFAQPGDVALLRGLFSGTWQVAASLESDSGIPATNPQDISANWLVRSVSAVPEPATASSMALGLSLLGAGFWMQRRRAHSGTA